MFCAENCQFGARLMPRKNQGFRGFTSGDSKDSQFPPVFRKRRACAAGVLRYATSPLEAWHAMTKNKERIDRRTFLNKSAAVIAGGAALSNSALSYARIAGSNERIALGHIGIGSRGTELDDIVAKISRDHNVEMAAVCDLWSVNREAARAANAEHYGRSPRAYEYLEELLEQKDIDAVLISTPDHSHSPILKLSVEAGKDVYVEKPMGNVLPEVKAVRDAVRSS